MCTEPLEADETTDTRGPLAGVLRTGTLWHDFPSALREGDWSQGSRVDTVHTFWQCLCSMEDGLSTVRSLTRP